jgi:hypothetical protein
MVNFCSSDSIDDNGGVNELLNQSWCQPQTGINAKHGMYAVEEQCVVELKSGCIDITLTGMSEYFDDTRISTGCRMNKMKFRRGYFLSQKLIRCFAKKGNKLRYDVV